MRLLQRPWPDRDRAELEVTPLPTKGLWLSPGLEDQLHRLGGTLARFGRVETVAQIFPGDTAQQPDHQATLQQDVQHRQLLGDLHRIALRHDWAKHCNLYGFRAGRQMGGRDNWGGCQAMRRIMVLGYADPIKAQLLDNRSRSTIPR